MRSMDKKTERMRAMEMELQNNPPRENSDGSITYRIMLTSSEGNKLVWVTVKDREDPKALELILQNEYGVGLGKVGCRYRPA